MTVAAGRPDDAFDYDVFISYSRSDLTFAERLHSALEAFVPPDGLDVPQRALRVFRDVSDLTGTDYFPAIEQHLARSLALVVICSPRARVSTYVDDEIRRFARLRDPSRIVPVLAAGIPNNEASEAHAEQRAFPDALCEVLEVPLALSYLGFDASSHRADDEPFLHAWYGLLANVYGVSRSRLEERDRRKRELDQATMARELTGAAIAVMDRDPELAQLLAAHALWATFRDAGTVIREAEEHVHRALHHGLRCRSAPAARLSGHRGAVWDVRFSPDGSQLASASEDQSWALWTAAGDLVGATAGTTPAGPVKALRFLPDGSRVLTAHLGGRATMWRVADGRPLGSLLVDAEVWDIDVSPDGRLAAVSSLDGVCRLFDLTSGELVRTIEAAAETPRAGGEPTPVVAVCFSPDGRALATAGRFGHCRIWDVASGRVLARLDGHTEAVMDVAFTPAGDRLATASEDGSWRLWDTQRGTELLRQPQAPPASQEEASAHAPMCVTFHPGGTRLAAGRRDRTVVLADASTGEAHLTITGHAGGVWGVAFSPDGRRLATASYDRTMCLWDVDDDRRVYGTFPGHSDTVAALTFSRDGTRLYTGGWDDLVCCWNLDDGSLRFRIEGQTGPVYALATSASGRWIASANGNGTATLWDADSGRPLRVFSGHDASVLGVAFGPGDEALVTAGYDGRTNIWDVGTGAIRLRLEGRHDHAGSALFGAGGTQIVTIGTGGPHDAVTPRNSSAIVWDRQRGEAVRSLDGHTAPLMALASSANGSLVVTAGQDHTARIWDVRTGQERATLRGHRRRLTSVAMSSDGGRIATGSLDQTVRLWRTSALSAPVVLDQWTGEVWSVAFSPDSRWLAVGGKARPVVVYPLSIETLIEHARWGSRYRTLTRDECRTYFGRDDSPVLGERAGRSV